MKLEFVWGGLFVFLPKTSDYADFKNVRARVGGINTKKRSTLKTCTDGVYYAALSDGKVRAFFALSVGRFSLSAGSPEKIHPSVFLRVFLRRPPSFLIRLRRRPSAFSPRPHKKKTHSPRCRCEYRGKNRVSRDRRPRRSRPTRYARNDIPRTLSCYV